MWMEDRMCIGTIRGGDSGNEASRIGKNRCLLFVHVGPRLRVAHFSLDPLFALCSIVRYLLLLSIAIVCY